MSMLTSQGASAAFRPISRPATIASTTSDWQRIASDAESMNALAYIGRRIVSTVPMLVLVGLITFLLIHLTPGDPAAVVAGENASMAAIEEARHRLGLDQPFLVQFWHWLVRVVGGGLGMS